MNPIEEVLREMDAVASCDLSLPREKQPYVHAETVAGWLQVLRPALMRLDPRDQSLSPGLPRGLTTWYTGETPPAESNIERFELSSNLPLRELRDMRVGIQLNVDHEGGGILQLDYGQVPHQHRLQALIQLMGALGNRIELAIGPRALTDMLRGIVAHRERKDR